MRDCRLLDFLDSTMALGSAHEVRAGRVVLVAGFIEPVAWEHEYVFVHESTIASKPSSQAIEPLKSDCTVRVAALMEIYDKILPRFLKLENKMPTMPEFPSKAPSLHRQP
jgi:hypothetical protein